MRVVVFGAGSLGSLLGGLLATTHDVTLVGRDPHVAAVRRDGLRIEGAIERTVHPTAVTELAADASADLAAVTVKSYDTTTAAAALAGADLGAVLSLQNGVGNEETLADRLACPVLAGTATYGALQEAPGVVECTGEGTVALGPWTDDPVAGERAEAARDAFDAAGIEAVLDRDVRRRLWEKLAVNAGINPVTALAGVENGAILEEPARRVATTAAREAAAVARQAGIDLDDDEAATAVLEVADATAANRSSMHRDLAAGRRTEIDAINGAVVDRADGPVPVNRTLAALVRTREAAADGR